MKVENTWGEIGCLLITLDGTMCVLYEEPLEKKRWTHGVVNNGSVQLGLAEAKAFRDQLSKAIKEYEELDEGYNEWVKRDKAKRRVS